MQQGSFRPFGDLIAFKFRQDSQHPKNHLPLGARRIDPFAEAHEIRPALGESITDGNRVFDRAGQA